MMKFVVDEDLPKSTASELGKAGYQVFDVRNVGLRGKSDDETFKFAQNQGAILVSADLDFANIIRFPIGSHNGILIVRFPPKVSNYEVNAQLLKVLSDLREEEIHGHLLIVEPGRVRVHKVF